MSAPDKWRTLPDRVRAAVARGSRDPFAAIGNAMDPDLGADRLVVAGPLEAEVAALRAALTDMRGWADVYEDHMSAHHFDQRAAAMARADALLNPYAERPTT